MRLLDHVAQSVAPLVVRSPGGELWRLSGAADYAGQLARCPLRYVLSDDLVRTCTALAYSEGDELSGCLDLLHLPAELLWVEWDEGARRAELARTVPQWTGAAGPPVLRAGALISAQPGGRAGSLRSFWLESAAPAEALLAPVETLLDFDGDRAPAGGDADAWLAGQPLGVRDAANAQLDRLLQCASFRLDPLWQPYYRSAARDAAQRDAVMHGCLAAVVSDVPMLLALFLLLTIRAELVQRQVDPARLNAKRARLGRQALLEHIEVSAPVFAQAPRRLAEAPGAERRAPRLHHVRGHVVRRHNTVYWRAPHWRGHVRLGSVRSRTVELRLVRRQLTPTGTAPDARGSGG